MLGSADAGIGVPPHGMVVQSLARLLNGSRVVALNVTTSVGRVVAAVLETSAGNQPGAWLPAGRGRRRPARCCPACRERRAGGSSTSRCPAPATPQVKVTAITARGSYQPTGGSGIDLPGGSAIGVALPSLGGIPAAIQVSSNVPVTASMGMPGGAAGAPGAFTAAAAAVQEQGVVAGNPGSAGGTSRAGALGAPGRGAGTGDRADGRGRRPRPPARSRWPPATPRSSR